MIMSSLVAHYFLFRSFRKTLAAAKLPILALVLLSLWAKHGASEESVRESSTVERTSHRHEVGGRIVEEIRELDLDKDGQTDVVSLTSFHYDERGRLEKKIVGLDRDGSKCPKETTTFQYDGSGLELVRETMERDVNCDDRADYRTVTDFEYEKGLLAGKVELIYSYIGLPPSRRNVSEYVYSDNGTLIRETITTFSTKTDTPKSVTVNHFKHEDDKLVMKISEYASDTNGDVSRRTVTHFDYDDRGALINETTRRDDGADRRANRLETVNFQQTHEIVADYTRLWAILANALVVLILLVFILRKRSELRDHA